MKDIRVVYMGTPDFSLEPLKILMKNTNVVLVVSKPDALVGRKKVLTSSPVKKLAEEHNIPIFTPESIKKDYQPIIDARPDLIVTCAYGKIIPKILIEYPKYGCVNIHASLLPKYRGSAPIQWALINGEKETGITLMYMDEFMDTGDMIDVVKYTIKDTDDIGTLHNELSILGGKLLEKNLDNLISGNVKRIKQNGEDATYAPMIERKMEELDFNDLVININNKIRAFSPWPLTRTKIKNEEIKIIKVHYTNEKSEVNKLYVTKDSLGIGAIDGIIYLDVIKPIGKNAMEIKNYLNGKKELFK
ncbi:MAG: methionyl-tRNA formyltransferase [Firmicutes bacterium]|nr:methionyl-tRNA formyltransferase [Bacillota bacterium]